MRKIWLAGMLVLLLASQIAPGFWHGRFGVLEDGYSITNSVEQPVTPNTGSHLHIDPCHTTPTVAMLTNNISLIVLLITFFIVVPLNFASDLSFPPITPPPRRI
jgi:hypothetical protein